MATDDYTGSYVRIETQDGIYEGYIHRVDLCNKKLSLERVVLKDSENERKLQGIRHFYGQELETLEILKDCSLKMPGNKEDHRKEYGQSILNKGRKHIPAHLLNLKEREASSDLPLEREEIAHGEVKDSKGSFQSGYDSGIDQEAGQSVLSKFSFTVIDKLDNQLFTDALAYISDQNIIGVALEGIDMGRDGELCWIQMASSDHVFLFDVKTMGAKCFSEGLKSVLESENIQKVLHNCRLPSDILWHQYQVKLVNIFDTQVADVFVYRNCHAGDWPRYVHGLPIILMEYLELNINEIHIMKVRKSCPQADEAFWGERPASQKAIDAAIKDVAYLCRLRRFLMEKMLSEYTAGVDLFLNHVRGASKSALQAMKDGSHLLPTDFQELSLSVNNIMSKRKHFKNDWVMKDTHGFRENIKRVPKELFVNRGISEDHTIGHDPSTKPVDVVGKNLTSPSTKVVNQPGIAAHSSLSLRSTSPVSVSSDSPVVRPAVGRGSSLVQITSDPIPGLASFEKTEMETKPLAQKTDWDSLVKTECQTDFTGITLKPAGLHETKCPSKIQAKLDQRGDSIHNGESKWGAQSQLNRERKYAESFQPEQELEEDCFDVIPSSKSSAKVALPSVQETSSLSDFESIALNANILESQNAAFEARTSNDVKNSVLTGSLPCLASSNTSIISERKRRPVCPRLPHHVPLNRKPNSEDTSPCENSPPSVLNNSAELAPIVENQCSSQSSSTAPQYQQDHSVSVTESPNVLQSSSEDHRQTVCCSVDSSHITPSIKTLSTNTPSINTSSSLLKLKSLMEQLKAKKQAP